MRKNKNLKQTLLNFTKLTSSTTVPSESSVAIADDSTSNVFESGTIQLDTRNEIFSKTHGLNQNNINAPTLSTSSQPNNVWDLDESMEISNQLSPTKNEERSYKRISSTSTADRKFHGKWLIIFPWLIEKKARAFCKYCEQSLPNNFSLLKRHNDSKYHLNMINSLKKQSRIEELSGVGEQHLIEKQKLADLKILMFLIGNNLPFNLIDPLIDLIKSIDPESKICKRLKLSRTKGTDTITTLLAEEGTENLTKMLQNRNFSLIIDETTDVSSKKCLALIARYFDDTTNSTKDSFLAMLELEQTDAQSVFDCITNFFEAHKIPLGNLIGFAADNASVMMGKTAGVQALLKLKNPYIYSLGCTCHSLHLCSSKAARQLPDQCEKLTRDIYSYFSHSPKRLNEFKSFQKGFDVPVHKILKTSKTRWLALQQVISRILEQWKPLQHYFLLEKFEAKNLYKDLATDISNELNTNNLIYFYFLDYILKLTNNLNKEFQSESPKIYKLLPAVKSLILTVLHNFVGKEYIDENNLDSTNFNLDFIYIESTSIYIGPKAELEITKCGLPAHNISTIKENCKKYYIVLCQQIINRFDFKDETLINLQCIDPENLGLTLIPLINLFPQLCSGNIDEIEEEYRTVLFQKFVPVSSDLTEFWGKIFLLKNGLDEYRYPNLKQFIGGLLSLPHSSAAAERCFSDLNNIKTKNRNCLKPETINALMIAKQLTKEISLCEWIPSKNLVAKYKLA